MKEEMRFTESCGNVFADLGLPDPGILLAKARLAGRISDIIEERGLTQKDAAKILGVDQPKVSLITRGQLDRFSIERLMQLLTKFDQDIEIVVKPAKQTGHFTTTVAAVTGD